MTARGPDPGATAMPRPCDDFTPSLSCRFSYSHGFCSFLQHAADHATSDQSLHVSLPACFAIHVAYMQCFLVFSLVQHKQFMRNLPT